MSTTLRLGFAMGGGVSLGTFNGAALAQAIKLLQLRGKDSNGTRFGKIEIDVFSGASAGSMSLALMMRSLLHATRAQQSAARARLKDEFGAEFEDEPPRVQRDLVAAQVMQDVQEQVWVYETTLDRMLGRRPDGSARGLRDIGSLLDRRAVDDIAREYFPFPSDPIDLSGRKILARRVLFASSITSLTGTIADARKEFGASEGSLLGLLDGMRSKLHGELRVFDLNFCSLDQATFDDPERHPARWCRYHEGGQMDGVAGTLRDPRTWRKVAATAVASGAFPLAFEPVVLRRKRFEYGSTWPKKLKNMDEAAFSFVDGGLFNNEPIREAFRLASFIDAIDPAPDFERCIVFVDPNVSDSPLSLRVPIHQRWFLEDPNFAGRLDGVSLERRSTLDRIVPHLGQIFASLSSQASRVEGDKIFQTRNLFDLRDRIRAHLGVNLRRRIGLAPLKQLVKYCDGQLKKNRREAMVPPASVTLASELERVLAEETHDDPSSPLTPLQRKASGFLVDSSTATEQERPLWLRALTYVAVDLIMDLSGKLSRSHLVAIAPYKDISNPQTAQPYALPGGAVAGFGGFTSTVARQHDVAVAKYCAQMFLEEAGLVTKGARGPFPKWTTANQNEFLANLRHGMDDLSNRISDAVKESHFLNLFPGLDSTINFFISKKVASLMLDAATPSSPTVTYQFRIAVGDSDYEFDGKGVVLGDRDIKPVRLEDGKLYLITFADYEADTGVWSCPHLAKKRPAIQVDRDGIVVDKSFCTIRLPSAATRKKADLLPNPILLAEVKKTHKGKNLPATSWSVLPGVEPLEDEL